MCRMEDMNKNYENLRRDVEELTTGLQMQSSQNPPVERTQLVERLEAVYTDDDYEHSYASRLDGTCDWILQREQFQAWMAHASTSDARRLWIHGPGGFGKTILSASLGHHCRCTQSLPTAFFFCNSNNEAGRRPLAIVRSWVAQLMNEHPAALEAAREIYHRKELRTVTTSDVWKLHEAIWLRKNNCVFVVDGFDECIKSTAHDRIAFLRKLIRCADNTGIRILVVSRNESDIGYELGAEQRTTPLSNLRFFKYEIMIEDTQGEIKAFADCVIGQELSNKSTKFRNEISETAADRSRGMLLWVELLRRRLSRGLTSQQLRDTVSMTPLGLDQAYERDLKQILDLETVKKDRAIAILRWTSFVSRPLTIGELTEALMTESIGHFAKEHADDSPDDWNVYYANEQIRNPCGTPIEFRGREGSEPVKRWTVHFVHSSVR